MMTYLSKQELAHLAVNDETAKRSFCQLLR